MRSCGIWKAHVWDGMGVSRNLYESVKNFYDFIKNQKIIYKEKRKAVGYIKYFEHNRKITIKKSVFISLKLW